MRRRKGSAITSISAIFPQVIVKLSTLNSRPRGAQTESHRPVDERRLHESGNLRECECPRGPVPRPTDLPRRTRTRQSFVYSHHDIWVEYREKAFEVTGAQGSEEGVDHTSLLGKFGIGNRGGSLHAAARLASCRVAVGERPRMLAISSKGTANMSCSTKASRSAGVSLSSITSSARPTESANSASCSGSVPLRCLQPARAGAARDCSRRDVRERNMSRQTRATTVVSQPRDCRCRWRRSD